MTQREHGCSEPITVVYKLSEGTDPEEVAKKSGTLYVGQVGDIPGYHEYIIGCADGHPGGRDAATDEVIEHMEKTRAPLPEGVVWHEPQRKRLMRPRSSAETIIPSGGSLGGRFGDRLRNRLSGIKERGKSLLHKGKNKVVERTDVKTERRDDTRDDIRPIDVTTLTTYVPKQWHIIDSNNEGYMRVIGAWMKGYMGQGTYIGVIDDGLDGTHQDIKRKFASDLSGNYNSGNRNDPYPRFDDSHGTGASGVAGASGVNGPPGQPACGHGVAPLATLVGIRLISDPVSDADEARGLSHRMGDMTVYSCSWGPTDDGATLGAPGRLAYAAIETAAKTGRGGLGTVYVWAAGNGHENGDSCSYDGYASNPNVIAVAAVTHKGNPAYYSEGCPSTFVSAPSSGEGKAIVTTDIAGRRGASIGDCRNDFGGTSAAAPIVAGVVGIIVSANPMLTDREIMRIIASTSRKINPEYPGWQRNGAGYWHNPRFGFGVIDAEAASSMASTWPTTYQGYSAPETVSAEFVADYCDRYQRQSTVSDRAPRMRPSDYSAGNTGGESSLRVSKTYMSEGCQIPDAEPECGAQATVSVSSGSISGLRNGDVFIVERAEAIVCAKHTKRGELLFRLTSPSGTVSRFEPRPRDLNRDYTDWVFGSVEYWGEDADGTWTLVASDTIAGNRGKLCGFTLRLRGYIRKARE